MPPVQVRARIDRVGTRLHLQLHCCGGVGMDALVRRRCLVYVLRSRFDYWRDCAVLKDGTISVADKRAARQTLAQFLEDYIPLEAITNLEEVLR